jgi:hypothetical protein
LGGTPSGAIVPNCYGINFNQPVTSTTCKYCGDGVFTPGNEQCDPTAPPGNGNDPLNCTVNCQLIGQVCIDLEENGSDPINAGVGNTIEYVFTYQNSATTNPYPNIRLAVNTFTSPLGRDANSPSQSLVATYTTPTFNSLTNRWTYRFLWEAASPSGVPVANGTYNVRVYLDGTAGGIVTTPSPCTESVTVQSTAPQSPIFTIIKQSTHVCLPNGSALINYTITVRNVGPVNGVIDFVTDNIDANIVALGITPSNINPTFGTYNSSTGTITWAGSVADRTFAPSQSKIYTYSITLPQNTLLNFFNLGVYNIATVQYDTPSTNDNTSSFEVRTFLNCTLNNIPITNISDGYRTILLGCLFMMMGVLFFVTEKGRQTSVLFYNSTITPFSNGLKDMLIPGHKENRLLEKTFERKANHRKKKH